MLVDLKYELSGGADVIAQRLMAKEWRSFGEVSGWMARGLQLADLDQVTPNVTVPMAYVRLCRSGCAAPGSGASQSGARQPSSRYPQ